MKSKSIHLLASAGLTAVQHSAQAAPARPPGLVAIPGLTPIGQYASGVFDGGAAGVATYDPATRLIFVVNSSQRSVDVLSIKNPALPIKIGSINLARSAPTSFGAPRSVALRDGILAVSFEAIPKTDPGVVVFLAATVEESMSSGVQLQVELINEVQVGALPDMITYTPNGRYLLVANEGEPNSYNDVNFATLGPSVDPEGSVTIIDVSGGVENIEGHDVRVAGFHAFDGQETALREAGVRIYGPNAGASRDLEPEHIAVSHDSRTAWVTLQENNALATIDLISGTVKELIPLGTKDHSVIQNGLDPSDRDNAAGTGAAIKIGNWPVRGMYQPDAIAAYTFKGETYLVTANEGDVRNYPGLLPPPASGSEDIRVGDPAYALDPDVFSPETAAFLKQNRNLGRLQASRVTGDIDGDGAFDEIHTFGGRSFSIQSASGDLVFDSGDQFEKITAEYSPANFNANNSNNNPDTRSDDSGPEPESLVLGKVFGRQLAFIALERIGGVMIYDITNPKYSRFCNYINTRNFSVVPSAATIPPKSAPNSGDLSPEALVFIGEHESPNGKPLLVVTHDLSGTTTVFEVIRE